jgi:hypothetical protein
MVDLTQTSHAEASFVSSIMNGLSGAIAQFHVGVLADDTKKNEATRWFGGKVNSGNVFSEQTPNKKN